MSSDQLFHQRFGLTAVHGLEPSRGGNGGRISRLRLQHLHQHRLGLRRGELGVGLHHQQCGEPGDVEPCAQFGGHHLIGHPVDGPAAISTVGHRPQHQCIQSLVNNGDDGVRTRGQLPARGLRQQPTTVGGQPREGIAHRRHPLRRGGDGNEIGLRKVPIVHSFFLGPHGRRATVLFVPVPRFLHDALARFAQVDLAVGFVLDGACERT